MPAEIDIKAAGTAMRFMTAYLSLTPGTHVLTGTERMKHRPIGTLVDALLKLGADIEYVGEQGYPPLRITGSKLQGGDLEMDGSISSQYISALLLIGPMLERGLSLHLTGDIISRPYIDLTLWMMERVWRPCRMDRGRHYHRGAAALQAQRLLHRERLERSELLV